MYKITSIFILVTLFNLTIFAQKEKSQNLSDFIGTWILDEKNSFNFPEDKEYFEDYTLIISHTDLEVKIDQKYLFRDRLSEHTIKLFTDKRGEENKYTIRKYSRNEKEPDVYWLEDIDLSSKTYFKKGKIIREGSGQSLQSMPFVLKETYKLSEDGKTLRIITEKTYLTTAASTGGYLERESYSQRTSTSGAFTLIFHKKD